MRILEKVQATLSEDDVNDPKQIRFSQIYENVDLTQLKECLQRVESFPIGSHSIGMGNIAQGRWLFLKADKDIGVSINSGTVLTLRAGKATMMWVNFTSLDLVVSVVTVVTLLVAGE